MPQIKPGEYVFTIQRWSTSGLQDREQIYFTAKNIASGHQLMEDEAEKLVTTAALQGRDWLEAANLVDCNMAAEVAESLMSYSCKKYADHIRQKEAENNDRADLQERTLDQHLENQLNKFQRIKDIHIQKDRLSLAKATDAKMKIIEERVIHKKIQIRNRRSLKSRKDEMCIGLIKVA